MYEKIVEQGATDFGVDPHQVKKVLGEVIGLAFNPKHGGPEGFLQAFREVGLGDIVSSWLGHGENRPITAHELETALGADAGGFGGVVQHLLDDVILWLQFR